MGINFIENLRYLALNTYHVDPGVFIFLMLASSLPYYWGWYALLKEVVLFRKKYRDVDNHLKVTDILVERGFLLSLGINRIAWVAPYIYVIFWGQNIPSWFWFAFFGWIAISTYLFWNKLKAKISNVE